jgi:hypothetical protein
MPGPSKDDSSTPEDLLKEEIDDLEKPMLHAWLPWIIAIVGVFVVCIIVAMCFLITPSSVFRGPKTDSGLTVLTLAQPQGRIQGAPREFQWDGLAGAATYIVTITEDQTDRVLLLRPVNATVLQPTDVEVSQMKQGLYSWSVEARGADDKPLAQGEAAFVIEKGP